MRMVAFGMGMAVLVLALVTAGWHADAHRIAGENEQLEREIARLQRESGREIETVDRLRQPDAIEARFVTLSKSESADPKAKKDSAADAQKKPKGNTTKETADGRSKVTKNDAAHSNTTNGKSTARNPRPRVSP
ncbi:MAG: hypothetical protein HY286_12985 [Planctomycetes bacterium]|nr:hypothetical protein [Planctomycetota bacterium]